MSKEQFPRIWGYMSRLHERESYKRAVQKIETVEGEFQVESVRGGAGGIRQVCRQCKASRPEIQ